MKPATTAFSLRAALDAQSGPWTDSRPQAIRRKIRSCNPRSSRLPRKWSTRAAGLSRPRNERLKAEAEAKEAPTTAYTPRSLVYHRAKTSFRDEPSNKPYSTVSTGRRLALARWIVDRRNPLTARVAVNHIWMRHFGDPLVASTFDFGLRTQAARASRASRLAGRRVHGVGLEHETPASAHRHLARRTECNRQAVRRSRPTPRSTPTTTTSGE